MNKELTDLIERYSNLLLPEMFSQSAENIKHLIPNLHEDDYNSILDNDNMIDNLVNFVFQKAYFHKLSIEGGKLTYAVDRKLHIEELLQAIAVYRYQTESLKKSPCNDQLYTLEEALNTREIQLIIETLMTITTQIYSHDTYVLTGVNATKGIKMQSDSRKNGGKTAEKQTPVHRLIESMYKAIYESPLSVNCRAELVYTAISNQLIRYLDYQKLDSSITDLFSVYTPIDGNKKFDAPAKESVQKILAKTDFWKQNKIKLSSRKEKTTSLTNLENLLKNKFPKKKITEILTNFQ